MNKLFRQYIINLFNEVPAEVYGGLLSIFVLGSLIIFVLYGLKRGWKKVTGLLLAEYVFLIYSSTVFFRTFSENVGHDFHLFWSYIAIQQGGKDDLIAENIMNVLVFVPVELLFGMTFRSIKWWQAILFGFCLSIGIEALQYFFHRGFTETDDVMHNTLGCVIGFGLYKTIVFVRRSIVRRKIAI